MSGGIDRRHFIIGIIGGLTGLTIFQDDGTGDDGFLGGGGGGAGNQPTDEPTEESTEEPGDWLLVATGATETLAAGEANEYAGIDWETDGAITWEDGATLTLRQ